MTPNELKNSILQMAIQGKLVEQRPEEGTAEELYQQIQAEKQKLIKEKKIKKDKPLPEITDDEKPFDIPDSWKWARWGAIVNVVSARRVHQSDWRAEGIPFYRAREIARLSEDGSIDNDLFISKELYEEFAKSGVPHPGDLMVTAVGTLGKCYIVQENDCFYYKDASVICLENYGHVLPSYLKYLMQSKMMMNQIKSNSSGTTVGTLTIVRMCEYIMPLPPLAEQKRIVAKIEELLPLIDRYEAAWSRLEAFNKRFPEDMQNSILQQAIQGKLVAQRPEEGTGEELYQQIQAEKQALIKAKKIKKEKPLPEITDDEKLFDIPDSWKWVRLSEICNVSDGTHQTPKYVENGIPFISAQNVKPYKFIPEIHRDVSYEDYLDYNKQVSPEKGDILMTRVGAGIGEAAIIDQQFDFSIYVSLTLIKCYLPQYDMAYLLNVLNSPLGNALAKKKTLGKGASQGNLNLCFIREFVLPLPPLAEQKRIVAKIEQLLPLCERLK